MRTALIAAIWLCLLWVAAPAGAQRRSGKPYIEMNYGPYLSATLEVNPDNFAYKGIAIRVDEGPGGVAQGDAFMLFDTDTLRYAAGWTGRDFIDWRGIAFDGAHRTHAKIIGPRVFTAKAAPGWADPVGGKFDDPRLRGTDGKPYGPLPRRWAHWKGLYRHGSQVVLSYSVGATNILEQPGLSRHGKATAMTRSLEIAPHQHELLLAVCRGPSGNMRLASAASLQASQDRTAGKTLAVLPIEGGELAEQTVVAAALVDPSSSARWQLSDRGQLLLRIAPSQQTQRFKLLIWRDKEALLDEFARLVRSSGPASNLTALTRGGPPLWQRSLTTRATIGRDDGPYVIDTLTLPHENPWRSWMRIGAFDFFADGRRAAVCTWQGDVWIVEGIGRGMDKLTWRRIAAGLFQPLGLKIVDERIYVLGRDQITRLHDLNGDGEIDFYENFNNDAQVTEHFHEFAMDLQTDAAGNFYYTKAARHALPAIVPQHGTLIKVAHDGGTSEILANGFRAPNGLLVNGDGTFISSDQEGHWTPMNRINWIRPGGFYGNMMSYVGRRTDTDYEAPLCWIHKSVDRSPAEQLWVDSDRWGPLQGALLSLSYGTGRIFNVLHEEVDGVRQGGIVRLPLAEFPTGVHRGRFYDGDGQLYACGLFVWSSNKTQPGGLYRIRYTGAQLDLPVALHAVRYGMVVTFTGPLDPETAVDPLRYRVQRWNYHRTANYGSDDYRLSDGRAGRDTVAVSGVKLSADRRSVFLQIPDMRTCMQMQIRYNLRTATGARLAQQIDHTIHRLGDPAALAKIDFPGGLSAPPPLADRPAAASLSQGLVLSLRADHPAATAADVQTARLPALHVMAGQAVSPLMEARPFVATWEGLLDVELTDRYMFYADGSGKFRLFINGAELLHTQGKTGLSQLIQSEPIELKAGGNAIRAELTSPGKGETGLRLYWSSNSFGREMIPPQRLRFDPKSSRIAQFDALHMGRELFANRSCAACHRLPDHLTDRKRAMPEMSRDNPSLEGLGSRLSADWVYHWLLDPAAVRNNTTMPRLLWADHGEDRQRAVDVAAYLATLKAPAEGDPKRGPSGNDLPRRGEILFEDLGCIACHTFAKPGTADPYDRTSLHFLASKFQPSALRSFLRAPHRHYASSRMGDFHLARDEASALSAYLQTSAKGRLAAVSIHGDPLRGKTVFSELGCAQCHRVDTTRAPIEPLLTKSIFTNPSSAGCLGEAETRGRAPDFRFSRAERDALLEFLARGGESLLRVAPLHYARRTMKTLNCAACHDRDGRRSPRPVIISDEGSQGLAVEIIPSLTWSGEKLKTDWAARFLEGRQTDLSRPWLKARMPAFPAHGELLAHGLAAQHGVGPRESAAPNFDSAEAEVGRRLSLQKGGFNCLQCHGVGKTPAVAPFDNRGVNFARVRQRLRYDYYRSWMTAPLRLDAQSKMPVYSPDRRTTAVTGVYQGQADRQFEALWHYLQSLGDDAAR